MGNKSSCVANGIKLDPLPRVDSAQMAVTEKLDDVDDNSSSSSESDTEVRLTNSANDDDRKGRCGRERKDSRSEVASKIFGILYQMMPIPTDAWTRRRDVSRCQHCDRWISCFCWYSHCRKCGMLLCCRCNRKRFCFPHMPKQQLKVCPWCYEALAKMDAELDNALRLLEWNCTREDLLCMISSELRNANLSLSNTKTLNLDQVDMVRHPTVELIKTTIRGAEAAITRAGPQALFTTGSVPLAAAGSAIVAAPVQIAFSAYELYKLNKRYKGGKITNEEFKWGIAAESSKGMFSAGGAVAGAVAGSVIPGIGTAVGVVVGGLFGVLASFVLGTTAHTAVMAIGKKVMKKQAVGKPNLELILAISCSLDASVQIMKEQSEFLATLRIRPIQIDAGILSQIANFEDSVNRYGLTHSKTERKLNDVWQIISRQASVENRASLLAEANKMVDLNRQASSSKALLSPHALMEAYARFLFRYISDECSTFDAAILEHIHELKTHSPEDTDLFQDADYLKIKEIFEKPDFDIVRSRNYVKAKLEDFSTSLSAQHKLDCLEDIIDACSTLLSENGIIPGAEAVNDALLYIILEFQPKMLYTNLAFVHEFLAKAASGKSAYEVAWLGVVVGSLANGSIH